MSRQAKIIIVTHLYPLYIICNLQWRLGDFVYTISTYLFPLILIYLWRTGNSVRLNNLEKRAIEFYIYFFILMGVYCCICEIANPLWIAEHNYYLVYFICFILIFYTLNRATERWIE